MRGIGLHGVLSWLRDRSCPYVALRHFSVSKGRVNRHSQGSVIFWSDGPTWQWVTCSSSPPVDLQMTSSWLRMQKSNPKFDDESLIFKSNRGTRGLCWNPMIVCESLISS